jgi:hypothetical protein
MREKEEKTRGERGALRNTTLIKMKGVVRKV